MANSENHELTSPPLQWGDLSPEEQEAVLELARDRLFWRAVYARLGWLRGATTIFLTLAAAFVLMRDGFMEWITQWLQSNSK